MKSFKKVLPKSEDESQRLGRMRKSIKERSKMGRIIIRITPLKDTSLLWRTDLSKSKSMDSALPKIVGSLFSLRTRSLNGLELRFFTVSMC